MVSLTVIFHFDVPVVSPTVISHFEVPVVSPSVDLIFQFEVSVETPYIISFWGNSGPPVYFSILRYKCMHGAIHPDDLIKRPIAGMSGIHELFTIITCP